MDCRDAAYSNNYYDLIVEYTDTKERYQFSSCVQELTQRYAIYYVNREGIPPMGVKNYTYTAIPKLFALVDEQAMDAAGVLAIQNQPALALRGRGILIGVIDTGERVVLLPGFPHKGGRKGNE